jgi:hypothetical protein
MALPCIALCQTDSLELLCPLENGTPRIIRASDRNYEKSSEYGVMLTSKTDTLVQACHAGTISIVAIAEDNRYDVVIFHRGYYFWYTGIVNPRVRKGSKVKEGDILGNYVPGEMIELLMFFQDEPMNPRKYLKCK